MKVPFKRLSVWIRQIFAIVLGFLLSSSTALFAVSIDISSAFTTDFIATSDSEEGIGVGGSQSMLGSQSYATSSGSFSGLPDSGVVSDGTHTFSLGPYDGLNSITKSLPNEQQSATFGLPPAVVDIANGRYSDMTVLFHWGSFGATGQNAVFTVTYTSGTPDVFDWKVADAASAGNTNGGVTPLVVGPLNRYFAVPTAFQTNFFSIFKQNFDIDESRIVDTITFDRGSATDNSGNNGYFNVFAVDGTNAVPEPSSLVLVFCVSSALFAQRKAQI